jgi:hypothetical protein
MDRTIKDVDDDGLTTPLIANLSLNSDADEDDVPLVQPPVNTTGDDDDYDGPFIPRRKTFGQAAAERCVTDSTSPPPKVCHARLQNVGLVSPRSPPPPPPPPPHLTKARNPVPKNSVVPQTPSPVHVVKKRVPSSPGPGMTRHDSLRDQALACPYLEQQAREENDDGNSLSGSCNSQDDNYLENLSCVTDGTCAHTYFKFNIIIG